MAVKMVFLLHLISIPVAFWVYEDARKQKLSCFTAVLWAVGVFVQLLIFLPLYVIFGRKKTYGKFYGSDDIIDVKATVVEEDYVKCQSCGKDVKADCAAKLKP